MLRAVATLLLACQALPFGAVVLCTGHSASAPHCASMAVMPAPASHLTMDHQSDHASTPWACPLTQLCAASVSVSLPAAAAHTTPTAVADVNEFAPSGSIVLTERLAPPVPPPNS